MYLEHEGAFTVREVARALSVSEGTVRSEISRGKLMAKLVGRAYRIPADVLAAYMDLGVQPTRADGAQAEEAEATEAG